MTGDQVNVTSEESTEPPQDSNESSEESVESTDSPLKNPDPEKVCMTTCRHDGKITGAARNSGHVSCSLCSHTFHKDCVNYPIHVTHFWACPFCKNLAAEVKSLHVKLDSVLSQNRGLIDTINQQQTLLNSLLPVCTQITALSKLIPGADSDDDDDEEETDVEPYGDLVIGDSLLRDVEATSETLTVDSMSGARFTDVRKKLKTVNPKKRQYARVVIVTGTNDSTTRRSADKIAADCKSTIAAAKRIATSVVLSSIPPRNDDRGDSTKIDNINQLMLTVANESDVEYVNHDLNFRFKDHSVDTAMLLPDQLHLSTSGVKKLLSNLSLVDKARPKSNNSARPQKPKQVWNPPPPPNTPAYPPPLMSCSVQPSASHQTTDPFAAPLYFRGGGSPLSNFFEAPIKIWNMNFASSEHAYQYRKSIALGCNEAAARVLRCAMPVEAKKIGDSLTTDDKWEDTKQGAMYEILRTKARQCPRYSAALRESGNRPLIENTPNIYWGKGLNGEGLNMLGRLHMMLRSELSLPVPQPRNFTPRPSVAPPRTPYGHTRPHSRQQQPRCFNCGEASHSQATCRHSSPLRCYSCNGLGHKKKFCQQSR